MNRLCRCQHLVQRVCYISFLRKRRPKYFVSLRDPEPKRPKYGLSHKAVKKIQSWIEILKAEIQENLATQKSIENLKFKDFVITPTGGNIIELFLPEKVKKNSDEFRQYFRNNAWIDLRVDRNEYTGFLVDFGENCLKVRINGVPPSTIREHSEITLSLPDDRFMLDFLLEFWREHKWMDYPGVENFYRAHYVFPMTFGRGRSWIEPINKNLNASQRRAVDLAMHPDQRMLSIQGPPGTGKTDVVAEIVMQYYRNDQNILVLTPSNKAADNVAERVHKLMNSDQKQYRMSGDIVEDSSSPFNLQKAIKSHKTFKNLTQACNISNEFWKDNILGQQAKRASDLHNSICSDIIGQANVIYSTFTSGSVRKLKKHKFYPDLVVIDEAAQVPECLAWFGILQARKAIIVGDQSQLGPVLRSEKANKSDYGKSVMSYLYEEFGDKIQARLKTQYRSNEKIMMWSNNSFYEGQLKADPSVRNITVKDLIKPSADCYTEPLVLIDTLNAGKTFHEHRVHTSFYNVGEAKLIENQVRALIAGGLNLQQIGVITPYRGQVDYIKNLLSDIENLAVSSVDAFQGREYEVILMSMVRSRRDAIQLGFLADMRRINVSMTRAKRQLFLVANSDTLKEHKELENLLNVIKEHGLVVKLSETNSTKPKTPISKD